MLKGNLTKEQAIILFGIDALNALERVGREPTCRAGYGGARQGDSLTEWSSYLHCTHIHGDEVILAAYYYTSNDQDQLIAETGDSGSIDWELEGYEII